jgi:hypothetical protein
MASTLVSKHRCKHLPHAGAPASATVHPGAICLLCLLPAGCRQVKRLAGATAANRKRAVIWASPPCTEYSRLKGGRPRALQAADACVAVIARIAADLDAAVVSTHAAG